MINTERLDKNIDIFSTPFKLLGASFGNRMTIITLPQSDLWVHSPISLNSDMVKKINELGNVKHIVSPNLFHHLHIQEFLTHFPNNHVYGVSGIEKKLTNSYTVNSLEKACHDGLWKPDIESILIEGMPKVNEVVFYHSSTKTLILTDLLFHFLNTKGWSKCLFTLYGVNEKLSISKLSKALIKDKAKFKNAIEKVLSWDFNKIILSHGEIVKNGGREKFEKSFDWLLK
jgi:hypothetical protein